MLYIFVLVAFITLIYSVVRFYFPPKSLLVKRCYEYILKERDTYKGRYEFMPRNLEKRFYKNIRGINKYNRRKIAEAVIEKLIQDNIVALVPNICIDVYRVVYVETSTSDSIML